MTLDPTQEGNINVCGPQAWEKSAHVFSSEHCTVRDTSLEHKHGEVQAKEAEGEGISFPMFHVYIASLNLDVISSRMRFTLYSPLPFQQPYSIMMRFHLQLVHPLDSNQLSGLS